MRHFTFCQPHFCSLTNYFVKRANNVALGSLSVSLITGSASSENGSDLFLPVTLDCFGHQMHLIQEELEADLSKVLCWQFMLSVTLVYGFKPKVGGGE